MEKRGSQVYIPLNAFCPKSFIVGGCEKEMIKWSWMACGHQNYIDD